MRRIFDLYFLATGHRGPIRINAHKIGCLKDKLPTDIDIVRRLTIFKDSPETYIPYSLELKNEDKLDFEKEMKLKCPRQRISSICYTFVKEKSFPILKVILNNE